VLHRTKPNCTGNRVGVHLHDYRAIVLTI